MIHGNLGGILYFYFWYYNKNKLANVLSMKKVCPSLFVSLVEQTNDAVFILRVEAEKRRFIIEYVNAAYLRKFSHTAEELIGKDLKEILNAEKYELVSKQLFSCVNCKSPFSYEETIVLDNETLFSLSEAFPILDSNQEVTHLIGLSKDITELKRQQTLLYESENTLQAIINSSDNITLVIDPGLRIIYANTAAQHHARRLLGKPYEVGDLIMNYLTLEQQKTAAMHFDDILLSNAKNYAFEHHFTYPDGEKVWLLRKYYSASDARGNYLGIVVNSVNITQRKKNELEIQKHTEALREIAKIQSHEIRRPVANIIGLTEMINTHKPHELEEIVAHLHKSALELDEVIKQVITKTYNFNI
jgi:PAS domain S-box-containing protein